MKDLSKIEVRHEVYKEMLEKLRGPETCGFCHALYLMDGVEAMDLEKLTELWKRRPKKDYNDNPIKKGHFDFWFTPKDMTKRIPIIERCIKATKSKQS